MIKQIVFMTIFAMSFGANAKDLKVLKDAHYQEPTVIHLRTLGSEALKNQPLSNFELVGVTMRAKSRNGNGSATLIVGDDGSHKKVEQFGDEIFFNVSAPWSYHTISWNFADMPGIQSEIWQIHTRGNIKIDEITLRLRKASNVKRVRIALGNQMLEGENTVHLKSEIQKLGHNPQGDKLRRVVFVAKSRGGNASAGVQTGKVFSKALTVGKTQNGLPFGSNEGDSYNRMIWNFSGKTPGVWQLHMKGKIKAKAIIVEYKE